MRRIFFVNRYFPPDHSATSQLVGDLASHLVRCGYSVTAVTSQQLYDQPQALLPSYSVLNGVEIRRVPTTKFGRSNLLGRAADYFSFYWSARRFLLATAHRDDVIIAMTDPPLISVVAMDVARRRGAHLLNWLQDLYPELAVELAVSFLKGPLPSTLSYLRDRSLKAAAANIVVGQRMAEKVKGRGILPDRIHVVQNWTDDEEIRPSPPGENLLRRKWGLDDKFVVGYSGNLGRVHEYDTVLAAAEQLREASKIVFLCIGSGHLMLELAKRVKERCLENFRFYNYQPQDQLTLSLGIPDVHWISLNPKLEGCVVPSKFYGIAAVGRPVIAVCAKDGEISRLVNQYQCGVVIEPGDPGNLAKAITELSRNHDLRDRMGRNARAMLDANFTRRQALASWQKLLDNIARS